MRTVAGLAFLAAGFFLMVIIVDPFFAAGIAFLIAGLHLCHS